MYGEKLKIITIVGARPQFVKAAIFSHEISKYEDIDEKIIHTGQHFDENMSKIFFDEMKIPRPDYNLEINSLSHGAMTGRMLEKIEEILIENRPDYLVVFGDTNSTLAGALAASKLHIKVIHIEAGLRSFNMKMPEEQNRILTDRLSSFLFCPTDHAIKNLQDEGYNSFDCTIVKSGDVMNDAALHYAKLDKELSFKNDKIIEGKFILATIHRAENTDSKERIEAIIKALNKINKEIPIVMPVHPRTKNIFKNLDIECEFIQIDPVGYLDMIYLLKNCQMVMTDSGGLQKEAYFFSKNCVTLRDQTEWVELLDGGYNELVGADEVKILAGFEKMKKSKKEFNPSLYGSGKACEVIVNTLRKDFE
jgi:UDP-GlcNAc3NAcA epimerase